MSRSLVSPEVASLRPYEPGKPIDEVRRELGVEDPVKLASNENAWGPSPAAVKAIAEAAAEVHLYPDGAAFHLRQELAAHLDVEPGRIVFGNGSNELIELVVRAFALEGDNVVTSAVSFVAYKIATLAAGREFREAPVDDGLGIDLDAVLGRCDERTRVVFLANPNNPTGTHLEAAAVDAFVAALDERFGEDPPIVVLDEAYLEYVDS
ncbi:MAG: aminotransferase class I/II-fold pyridoxal phosphate-dependent enzyme, partial [Myxococcales bacterium]|nr:aminotransferase class I/II-fold pyridoxal phosphate-dependent enzyme [Myxococcales bacterium]